MRTIYLLICVLLTSAAAAEPMKFRFLSTGGNACCSYIQATGEITEDTPQAFEDFLRAEKPPASSVRLNSRGGSLLGGLALGEKFRKHGYGTDVGSTDASRDLAPGVCASACAYAFLGGTERSLEPNSKLGFHRFSVKSGLEQPTAKLFTGHDLDSAQRITAALVFYTMKMGIDPRLVVLASGSAPDEVRWLSQDEARDLRVVYKPHDYKGWRLEPYRNGALAVAESNDGLHRIVAGCSRAVGPYVALIDLSPTGDTAWFAQCRNLTMDGRAHPVFGARVEPNRVQVFRTRQAAIMRFQLPTNNPPLSSADFLTFGDYPRACATNKYRASQENFVFAVRLALRNCHRD